MKLYIVAQDYDLDQLEVFLDRKQALDFASHCGIAKLVEREIHPLHAIIADPSAAMVDENIRELLL